MQWNAPRQRTQLLLGVAVALCGLATPGLADDPKPIGQFLTLNSPLDDRALTQFTTVAAKLVQQAEQEQRPAFLVIEIPQGSTPFHHLQALTRQLTSNQYANLRTVAWVPKTITGPNVLAVLACRDIVMHPDAELGDIGRGKPVELEDQQVALALAQKRHNPRVSTALIRAMLDPQEALWLVRTAGEGANGMPETRAVTKAELEALQKTGVAIERAEVIKEPGVLGVFRGTTARQLEILVSHLAENRTDVAALFNLPREALRELPSENQNRKVRLIRVTGVIDTLQESFLERQIDRAVGGGADLLIFEIDSPGGLMLASINLAQKIASLDEKKVRTVAWVPKMALSGAAIISLGCDDIFMHPTAQIGDAGPIEIRPGQPVERAPEKILSPLRATMKTLAERKGRPVAVAEAMVDRQLKVFQATNRETGRVWFLSELELQGSDEWNPGPQVREANGELLLTVEGTRAFELKIAEPPVNDVEELKTRLGLPAGMALNPVGKTWVDTTVFILNRPWVTGLLFVLGIVCLYLEANFPISLFGIGAVICFAIFFWSRFLGGTAGWLEVILFILGAGALAMEIFVIPGFGVFGITGILMLLASVVMASQSFGNLEPYGDMKQLLTTLTTFLGAMIGLGVAAAILSRFLPHVPLFEGMVLTSPGSLEASRSHEPQLAPGLLSSARDSFSDLVGKQGETMSLLRPSGKARFDGRVCDVVSEGSYIPEGTPIEVIRVNGNRITVRAVSAS